MEEDLRELSGIQVTLQPVGLEGGVCVACVCAWGAGPEWGGHRVVR